jgi:hypothetical protein
VAATHGEGAGLCIGTRGTASSPCGVGVSLAARPSTVAIEHQGDMPWSHGRPSAQLVAWFPLNIPVDALDVDCSPGAQGGLLNGNDVEIEVLPAADDVVPPDPRI